ncbi:hypothetical protein LCGC14_0328180 [marine sediment metagenome]|uniref:Uncharacterized protein n=1 Tax=marine sediment metagenome TaxID=412755 RepID=A0A0F9TMV6_9ZZZZ
MTKGIPLDLYLSQQSPSGLSEDELDRQLSSMSDIPVTSKANPSGSAASHKSDIELLLASAMSEIGEEQDAYNEIDSAIKAASHGVKVLSPLLAAASKWTNPDTEPDKFEALVGQVLSRVRNDALKVIQAYGIGSADAPTWLTSQVSGQIMTLLVSAIERNNGAILEPGDSRYLQPLINLGKKAAGISESYYSSPSDPNWQLINSLTMATADVMAEYHSFNYFRTDAESVSQEITDFLDDRVIHGTLNNLTERFNLGAKEKAYLGVSLLHQAGRTLANSWANNISQTLGYVKGLSKEQQREVVLSGCPLDEVFSDFNNVYQGLEISALSALRTLAPGREQNLEIKHAQSPV